MYMKGAGGIAQNSSLEKLQGYKLRHVMRNFDAFRVSAQK
jgi:hypothetical protein